MSSGSRIPTATPGSSCTSRRDTACLQYHEHKDEASYLLSGRLDLTQGAQHGALTEREIAPGAVWRNEARLVHTIEALDDATVLEVSTPELDDVVRLADQYGRATTSAAPSVIRRPRRRRH